MEEIWKDIIGYENKYQISNFGRVKSKENYFRYTHAKTNEVFYRLKKETILKNKTLRGYNFISLSKNSIQKNYRICRLVAIHFIDNPLNKPCVNHIDCNKSNDNVNNLEWVTYKENMIHARDNNLVSIKFGKDNVGSKKVRCKKTGIIFETIKDASLHFKISATQLGRVLKGIYSDRFGIEYA
jgi:hypothetical protein